MIVLGRIVAPFGVRGWVKVRPFGDDPASWSRMPRWWLCGEADGKDWQPHELCGVRPHGAQWIAKFDGVDDRTGAEGLEGQYVGAPREALPATAVDEYYWADLVGLAVINEQGDDLGRVDSLIETGANQVLVVQGTEGGVAVRRLLPFVGAVVREVDPAAHRIRVCWGRDW
jgi:16S rRNA processing protein RimM